MERKTRNQLLREVRERVSSGNYMEIHKLRSINSTCKVVILGNKKLDERGIYDYYEKLIALKDNEENELKAIGLLVDDEDFEDMSESEKQRYILDLSKLYLSLKNEIDK